MDRPLVAQFSTQSEYDAAMKAAEEVRNLMLIGRLNDCDVTVSFRHGVVRESSVNYVAHSPPKGKPSQ